MTGRHALLKNILKDGHTKDIHCLCQLQIRSWWNRPTLRRAGIWLLPPRRNRKYSKGQPQRNSRRLTGRAGTALEWAVGSIIRWPHLFGSTSCTSWMLKFLIMSFSILDIILDVLMLIQNLLQYVKCLHFTYCKITLQILWLRFVLVIQIVEKVWPNSWIFSRYLNTTKPARFDKIPKCHF